MTKEILVKADPRLELSDQDYNEIDVEVKRLGTILSQTNVMINDIDALKDVLMNLKKRLKSEDAKKI